MPTEKLITYLPTYDNTIVYVMITLVSINLMILLVQFLTRKLQHSTIVLELSTGHRCITLPLINVPLCSPQASVLQKRAIRIVCGAQRFDHTYPLFQLSKILPLINLYVYSAQLFLYKYHRQSLSNIFSGFFTINETIHNHYTRQIEHFHTHLAKSSQTARTLRCTGVKINNYFMNRLNYNCSDGVYKQKLKEHILMNDISHLYGGTR